MIAKISLPQNQLELTYQLNNRKLILLKSSQLNLLTSLQQTGFGSCWTSWGRRRPWAEPRHLQSLQPPRLRGSPVNVKAGAERASISLRAAYTMGLWDWLKRNMVIRTVEEWKYMSTGSGGQFVMISGTPRTRLWSADSWASAMH